MPARPFTKLTVIATAAAFGLTLARPSRRGRDLARHDVDPHPGGATQEHPPGRSADSPAQIPARGWWQVAKRVAGNIGTDRVLAEAAGVTFYALLAIFPALAALISLYGLFADPATIEHQVAQLNGVMPEGGVQLISQQAHSLAANPHQALGLGAIFGLLLSIWSANGGVKAMFDALNAVYEEKEKRSFLRRTLISLAFTLGALLFIILAMIAVVAVPAVISVARLGATGDLVLQLARWPVLLVMIIVALALLYRFGPSRSPARWRWLTWGSVFAAITWVLGSAAFSFYVALFGSYNKTYGSLGAAVGFMTWIWISTIIVLVGGELNAELEHQTEKDSTIGAPRRRGERGAVKADQLAA